MKNNRLLAALAGMGLTLATQANASLTFTFQENGSNVNLGNTSTFTESSVSVTASGFLTGGGATALYAKNSGAGETGLGLAHDPSGQNEITSDDFVQLTLPTTPPTTATMVLLASVQGGESAKVYYTTTPGTLAGATLIGSIVGADGSVTIPVGDQNGYIDITAGAANVILSGFTVNPVPEPSTYIAGALLLIPFGFSALRLVRRSKSLNEARDNH